MADEVMSLTIVQVVWVTIAMVSSCRLYRPRVDCHVTQVTEPWIHMLLTL